MLFHAFRVVYTVGKELDSHAKHEQSFKKLFGGITEYFSAKNPSSGFVQVSESFFFFRDAPIDWPVIGIGRFLAWPARINNWFHVTVSPIPSRSILLPAAQAETSQPCAVDITVVCKHVVLLENNSNFNGIECKRRLIMYLCRARWGLNSLSECVRETAHTKKLSEMYILW